MDLNSVIGITLIVLSVICICAGVLVGVVVGLRRLTAPQSKALPGEALLLEAIHLFRDMLATAGGLFFVVGLILLIIGIWILYKRPLGH